MKRTPLHIACTRRNTEIELIRLLLEAGADVEAKDVNLNTPFKIAHIFGGSREIIDLLEAYKTDIDIKEPDCL